MGTDSAVPKMVRAENAAAVSTRAALATTAKNMIWVGGGEFLMGSDDSYPEERPPHRVAVDGFWMKQAIPSRSQ